MEEGWERTQPTTPVNRAHVLTAIRGWDGDRPVKSFDVMTGGLVNSNVRVTLESPREHVVLRTYLGAPGARDTEAAVLERVAGLIPAPLVLARVPSDPPGLIMTLLPGRPLSQVSADASARVHGRAGADLGRTLARLHTLRLPALGHLDARLDVPSPMPSLRSTWYAYLDDALGGRAGKRLGPRQGPLRRLIDAEGDALAQYEGQHVLLHADCKPTNVLVHDDGALAGLIDWEFAWSGPPLFDLGQMFRWPVPDAFEAAFVNAYEAGAGPLPEEWRRHARLLDLVNLVGFLDRAGDQPVRNRDVLALIDAYDR